MIDQFKKELIDYGISQLPKFKPRDLDLYKELQITKLLDKYGDKWFGLHSALCAKKQEILGRPEATAVDDLTLQTEFEKAEITIRNKFMARYPLNL